MNIRSRFIFNAYAASIIFSAILFISAGRLDYPNGWIYALTSLVTTTMNVFWIRSDDELMTERTKPGDGTKSWDKTILGLSLLLSLAAVIAGGMDSGRYHWSQEFSWKLLASGAVLMLLGQTLFLVSRRENRFFSTVVRIQKERGHTVCDTGLYSVIRHPGYAGMILGTIGLPLVLGSVWSGMLCLVSIVPLIVRTSMEDHTLLEELNGYREYAGRTRFRLLSGIW
jgi:protein-S-isoprenylcysteine O-methyltransferase Ste14